MSIKEERPLVLFAAMNSLGFQYAGEHKIHKLTDPKEVLKHVEYAREHMYLPEPREHYAKQFRDPDCMKGLINHQILHAFGFRFIARLYMLPGYTHVTDEKLGIWFHFPSKLHICTQDSKYIDYDEYMSFPEVVQNDKDEVVDVICTECSVVIIDVDLQPFRTCEVCLNKEEQS